MPFEFPKEMNTDSVSRYTKLANGKTTLRLLGTPIFGYETWLVDSTGARTPKRFELGEEIDPADVGPDGKKQFMACKVWNYGTGTIQIWQASQKTLLKAIKEYAENEEYGDPTGYDIVIKREGEGKMTRYGLSANPPKELKKEIAEADAATPCDLDMLFLNGDPFIK